MDALMSSMEHTANAASVQTITENGRKENTSTLLPRGQRFLCHRKPKTFKGNSRLTALMKADVEF